MLHWKQVKTKWTIALLPTVMWNGKIFSPRSSIGLTASLHERKTAKVKQLPSVRNKTSYTSSICRWTCTPKRHPEPWCGVQRCTSGICSPASCCPCWPGQALLPAGWWLAPAHCPALTQQSWGRKVFQMKWCSPKSPEGNSISGRISRSHSAAEEARMLQRADMGKSMPIHLHCTAEHSNYRHGVQHACLFAALYHTLCNSLQEFILPLIQS